MRIDLPKIARFCFLLLITVLSIYFIIVNKNNEEHFDNITPITPQSRIISIYQDLFKNSPSSDTVQFYLNYFKNSSLNDQQLVDVISSTAPILEKALPQENLILYGDEDEVISIFNQILMRNPSTEELTSYSKLLKIDSTFSKEKLVQVLASTDEYKRFEKLQTNEANGTLLGGVTDRQIELTIDTIYSQISGKQIDQDTLKFLKRKFVEFNLSENTLRAFIFKYVFGDGSNQPVSSSTKSSHILPKPSSPPLLPEQSPHPPLPSSIPATSSATSSASTQIATSPATQEKIPLIIPITQEMVTTEETSTRPWYSVSSSEISTFVESFQNSPNKETLECLLRTTYPDGYNDSQFMLDSQSVLYTIYSRGNAVFDKDKSRPDYVNNKLQRQKDDTILSDEIEKRNMENLHNACRRTSVDDIFINP